MCNCSDESPYTLPRPGFNPCRRPVFFRPSQSSRPSRWPLALAPFTEPRKARAFTSQQPHVCVSVAPLWPHQVFLHTVATHSWDGIYFGGISTTLKNLAKDLPLQV